ncbi:MAG: GNAT family N-acetyltransferase [Kutzneria sp.]|nr:GNAT family N-acetyltransferase [Kutzneria sp.]
MSAVQNYVRETAPRGRETARVGPFLATFTPGTDHPMLNYAIPDNGARPSPAQIVDLTEAFRCRGLLPRLEYFPEAAPALEHLLVNAGYTLERRTPLMVCAPDDRVDVPPPHGVAIGQPGSDDDVRRMRSAQNAAFGESPDITDEEVEEAKAAMAGGVAVLAADLTTGEVIGGGFALEVVDGAAEIAGIGVLETYRRRGVAAAITACLTRGAHQRNAHTVFLTAGGDGAERVYARVGYRTVGACLHFSNPSPRACHSRPRHRGQPDREVHSAPLGACDLLRADPRTAETAANEAVVTALSEHDE